MDTTSGITVWTNVGAAESQRKNESGEVQAVDGIFLPKEFDSNTASGIRPYIQDSLEQAQQQGNTLVS